MANRVAEIVRRANEVSCPSPQLQGDAYLLDLSIVKIRSGPYRALELKVYDAGAGMTHFIAEPGQSGPSPYPCGRSRDGLEPRSKGVMTRPRDVLLEDIFPSFQAWSVT
jgi:hypothetical protein